MSFSDDDTTTTIMQEPTAMSKAELRKSHKPQMEKKRRARINNCLAEIKNLILEAMNKDPARHTKLEKADILEMAVKHLQNVQKQQFTMAMATDPTVVRKFKNGFNDCATEINRFMSKNEALDGGVRDRVQNHLQKCITNLDHFPAPTVATIPLVTNPSIFNNSATNPDSTGDQNNNPHIGGIQVIPSRLPTGELALLVPNSLNLSYFSTPHRPSAFVSVTPQNEPPKILSPPLSPRAQGFRPLTIARPKPSYPKEDHQVAQVSSTMDQSLEVKTMKFPIHRPLEKHCSVIKKHPEPLGAITNQAERYKQAHQIEDTLLMVENHIPRGIKRNHTDEEGFVRPSKVIKISHGLAHSSTYVRPTTSDKPEEAHEAHYVKEEEKDEGDKEDQSDNMWRPW